MTGETRIDKLDDAFLFLIGSVSLIVSIIQVNIEGVIGLIEISPLLFLGIVLPFYIGYIRGAITLDTINERMRGWVYFVVGVVSYFAFFLEKQAHTSFFRL